MSLVVNVSLTVKLRIFFLHEPVTLTRTHLVLLAELRLDSFHSFLQIISIFPIGDSSKSRGLAHTPVGWRPHRSHFIRIARQIKLKILTKFNLLSLTKMLGTHIESHLTSSIIPLRIYKPSWTLISVKFLDFKISSTAAHILTIVQYLRAIFAQSTKIWLPPVRFRV